MLLVYSQPLKPTGITGHSLTLSISGLFNHNTGMTFCFLPNLISVHLLIFATKLEYCFQMSQLFYGICIYRVLPIK
jgi:hypothetical protein